MENLGVKKKISRDIIPENFTIGLALVDSLPVIFFGIYAVLLGILLKSIMIITGAMVCIVSGSGKVIWKLIVVLRKKNVWWMFVQMRLLMPIGFVTIIIGVLFHIKDDIFTEIAESALEMPVLPLLIIGALCFILMGIFAFVLDSSDVKSNWIEQITNAVGQFAILLAVIMLFYASGYSHADNSANEALLSTETVSIEVSDDFAAFIPNECNGTGIIFYPGGKVEFKAYAPLLKKLSEEGILCVSVRMPLQLAFFGMNKADSVIETYSKIDDWYMAGHSLGGVAASGYARNNSDRIDGMIFLASYATKPLNGLKVLSIYGSNDGVLNMDAYDKAKENWPEGATEIVISGGNHAQFGSYGLQNGDGNADISPDEQQKITCDAILEYIEQRTE